MDVCRGCGRVRPRSSDRYCRSCGQTLAKPLPVATIAVWVRRLLWANVGIQIVLVFMGTGLLATLFGTAGPVWPLSLDAKIPGDDAVVVYDALSGVQAVLILVTAVAWLGWVYRCCRAARALRPAADVPDARWAVAWWFVPVAAMWKPLDVMTGLWRSIHDRGRPATMDWWWGAYVAGIVIAALGPAAAMWFMDADPLAAELGAGALSDACWTVAGVLGVRIVRLVTPRLDANAERVGVHP